MLCLSARNASRTPLIETCKLYGVEPHAYLAEVITRIVNGYPNRQIDDLLPWAYPVAPALKAVA
jgi:transposase